MRRFVALSMLLWSVSSDPSVLLTGDEPGSEAQSDGTDKREHEARLAAMRDRAKTFEVERTAAEDRETVLLRDAPLFRYSDQPRGFIDAALWCWGGEGRPVALAKVEMVVDDRGAPFWQYCLASTAERPIAVRFGGAARFATSKPGVEFKPVPAAPAPHDKPAGRLRQMKEVFARFSATIRSKHVDGKDLVSQEMRPLASPLHRYAEPGAGVVDGLVFGLTTNGTNPDLILLIEAGADGIKPSGWRYALVRMTDAELRVRIDDQEAWTSPYPAPRTTWTSVFLPRPE